MLYRKNNHKPVTHYFWGDLHHLQCLILLVERTKEQILPALKNNAAAGYQSSVKTELLKGAGLLSFSAH